MLCGKTSAHPGCDCLIFLIHVQHLTYIMYQISHNTLWIKCQVYHTTHYQSPITGSSSTSRSICSQSTTSASFTGATGIIAITKPAITGVWGWGSGGWVGWVCMCVITHTHTHSQTLTYTSGKCGVPASQSRHTPGTTRTTETTTTTTCTTRTAGKEEAKHNSSSWRREIGE